MVCISVKKGLKIPLKGGNSPVAPLVDRSEIFAGQLIGCDFAVFDDVRIRPLVKIGDRILAGDSIAHDRSVIERIFVSPCSGKICDIVRGDKRRLLAIMITADGVQESKKFPVFDPSQSTREECIHHLCQAGLMPRIQKRPCAEMAHPQQLPESIFVKGISTMPFSPPVHLHCEGLHAEFQRGLEVLQRITPGSVHLVIDEAEQCPALVQARDAIKHTVRGAHPAENVSVHMAQIHRISHRDQVVWVLTVHDVTAIGYLVMHGICYAKKVVAIAGEGVPKEQRGFFLVPQGIRVEDLLCQPLVNEDVRLLSGSVLTGYVLEQSDVHGFLDHILSVLPVVRKRRFMHFFRLIGGGFTSYRAYVNPIRRIEGYSFSTLQHGEERAFVAGFVYDRVNPLWIPTMEFIKAILAKDYEQAEHLGLLEVAPEDFALQTFICPSKIPMMDIVKEGLRDYARQYIHG